MESNPSSLRPEGATDLLPRLALCGNVFPGDTMGSVFSALDGPAQEFATRLRSQGWQQSLGFGLYFSDFAVSELARNPSKQKRLAKCLANSGFKPWTANAFPFGGFHSGPVKEAVFMPDWRDSRRPSFTCRVAETLAHLLMPGDRASVSSCPLGYGPDARRSPKSLEFLRRAQTGLLRLEERTGVRITLGLEPEPDGAFERVGDLAEWLQANLYPETPIDERRVGVCWDLCHSAVVGEAPEDALAALSKHGIPLSKVQISSAIYLEGGVSPEQVTRLKALCDDPWLHQVRGTLKDGRPFAYSDLPRLLDNPAVLEVIDQLRVHCHVPVHQSDFGDELYGTPWKESVQLALKAGCLDFELETYTLSALPSGYLAQDGMMGTMTTEMEACADALWPQDSSH
ncbi:MAG: hypothetical protein CMJ96_05945 [Planctomycetes bacterium]|jgi:sugar phosphate isomerase/epimerase|nr:hypothetical protein [Planctomycetota bacterium]MDP7245596.1 metabolite traffic protein EboE [Planctomycetota bacterium]|tara:strand:+ start:39029 stop:40225 length:1197 start_codon:yes stop_codon:yes gene_type:complete